MNFQSSCDFVVTIWDTFLRGGTTSWSRSVDKSDNHLKAWRSLSMELLFQRLHILWVDRTPALCQERDVLGASTRDRTRRGGTLHVFLDRQHYGKPRPNHTDRGVPVDRDGDGKVETHEADLTPRYIAAAKAHLEAAGHTVTLVDTGTYSDRHAAVCNLARALPNAQRPAAYVACHLNAGGGSYGLIVPDARSKGGKAVAEQVKQSLRGSFSSAELADVKVFHGQSGDWTSNAWNTIKGIWAGPSWLSGICYEPVFVDTHRALLSDANLDRIGVALANGLMAWGAAQNEAVLESAGSLMVPILHDGVPLEAAPDRDPRQDPREGDLVVTGRGAAREVLGLRGERVVWRAWPNGERSNADTLEEWVKDLTNGAVIDVLRR